MTSTALAPGFICMEFVSDHAPEIGNPNYKGKPTPLCNTTWPTLEARNEHLRSAHASFLNGLSPRMRASVLFERYDGPAQDERPTVAPTKAEAGRFEDDEPGEYHEPSKTKAVTDASEKQLALIASLAERKGTEANEVRTAREASIEIERLMAMPDKGLRPNRYAGMCSECAQPVEAEAGFVRKLDDAWVTAHKPGDCPADAPKPTEVPDGYYAVMAEANHLSFYRVKAGRKPGVIFVDLLIGGGTNGTLAPQKVPYRNIPAVLAKIAVDPQGAMELFGQSVGKCGRCNRGLTDEVSRERGIGPECWSKMN